METPINHGWTAPNEATRLAIIEAQDPENLSTVDMSSYDAFLKSLELDFSSNSI